MSEYQPLQQHDLAQVLQRINALVQHQQSEPVPTEAEQVAIPLLTEIYQGDVDVLQAVAPPELGDLEQVINEGMDELEKDPEQPLSEHLAARFLAEVQPLILKAVKVAVLDESVKAEKLLTGKLEQDILQLLQQRLTSALPPR